MDLHVGIEMDVKNQQLLWDLDASIAMVVKNQQLLRDVYVGIAMVVKTPTIFIRLKCKYYNGCKKTSNYYETYMRVL